MQLAPEFMARPPPGAEPRTFLALASLTPTGWMGTLERLAAELSTLFRPSRASRRLAADLTTLFRQTAPTRRLAEAGGTLFVSTRNLLPSRAASRTPSARTPTAASLAGGGTAASPTIRSVPPSQGGA